MKLESFSKVVRETPVFVPIFTLTKMPPWLRSFNAPAIGDEFFVDRTGVLTHCVTGAYFSITPGYLKFKEYRNISRHAPVCPL